LTTTIAPGDTTRNTTNETEGGVAGVEAKDEERKEYFSPEEMAEWIGIGRTLAYRLLSSRQIPSYKIGRRRIVSRKDVEAWLEQQKSPAQK